MDADQVTAGSHAGVSALLARPRNQTPEHYALTLLGYAWLWRAGCRAIGFEVAVGSWTFDVVGVKWPTRGKSRDPQVFVVEAKGHRSDFRQEVARKARADAAAERLRTAREALEAFGTDREARIRIEREVVDAEIHGHAFQRDGLERRIGRTISAAEVDAVVELGRAEAALRKFQGWGTLAGAGRGYVPRIGKLWCETVLAETSARYVIAPDGVVQDGELPPGWGLLSPKPAIVTRCPPGPSAPARVTEILDHLARAFTYRVKDGLPGRRFDTNVSLPPFDELVEAYR